MLCLWAAAVAAAVVVPPEELLPVGEVALLQVVLLAWVAAVFRLHRDLPVAAVLMVAVILRPQRCLAEAVLLPVVAAAVLRPGRDLLDLLLHLAAELLPDLRLPEVVVAAEVVVQPVPAVEAFTADSVQVQRLPQAWVAGLIRRADPAVRMSRKEARKMIRNWKTKRKDCNASVTEIKAETKVPNVAVNLSFFHPLFS